MQSMVVSMPFMHSLFPLLQMFMVQFSSASIGESGAVFGIYYAVHECTIPPSFRCSWCSLQVLQWGRPVQFLGLSIPCLHALSPLLLEVHCEDFKCFNGGEPCNSWVHPCRAYMHPSPFFQRFIVLFLMLQWGRAVQYLGENICRVCMHSSPFRQMFMVHSSPPLQDVDDAIPTSHKGVNSGNLQCQNGGEK